jgi:hypothetical protein
MDSTAANAALENVRQQTSQLLERLPSQHEYFAHLRREVKGREPASAKN